MSPTQTLEERMSHVEQDLAKLKSQVDRLSATNDPAAADLPTDANPWLKGAGMFRDDPLFDDWQRAIVEYRHEADGIVDAP